jgi:hypothetical protein
LTDFHFSVKIESKKDASFMKIWFTLSIEPQGLRKANFKVRAAVELSSFKN